MIENPRFNRLRLLLGDEILNRVMKMRVIVFGVGGVGSWCAESLVRSGICNITLVDADKVCVTNINRQLLATTSTIDGVKVEVMKHRLLDINPDAQITALEKRYDESTASQFDLNDYDYVIDNMPYGVYLYPLNGVPWAVPFRRIRSQYAPFFFAYLRE